MCISLAKNNNRIKDNIIISLDILANIAGIATSIKLSKIVGIIIIAIAIIVFVIWTSIGLINFFKSEKAIILFKKEYIATSIQVCSVLHSIFHDIRDSSSNVLKQRVSDVESLDSYFKASEKNICTSIEGLFKTLWNKETCACIKMISASDLYNDDYRSWKIYTYSRGNASNSYSQKERSKYDQIPVQITENSDFEIIIKGKVNYFVCENMSNIHIDFKESYDMEYKNSRENQEGGTAKYYNATIVLPIRIQIKYRRKSKGNCDGYHLLGFLCIDTLSYFDKEDKQLFLLGVEYAKSISDSLYNQILNYFKARIAISNKTKNEKTSYNRKEKRHINV